MKAKELRELTTEELVKKVEDLKAEGFRVELDASNDKLGYRLRNSQMRCYHYRQQPHEHVSRFFQTIVSFLLSLYIQIYINYLPCALEIMASGIPTVYSTPSILRSTPMWS